MNRREFLKTLAGLGASVLVPIDWASASAVEVDAAWKAAKLSPIVFSVASWGTLSIGDYEEPGSRSEMYGIEANWTTREELADLIRSEWQLESIAENVATDAAEDHNRWSDDGEELSFDSWEDWFATASDDDVAYLGNQIRNWLDDKPDLGAEYEWLPPMNTLTPESRAYTFFKCQNESVVEELGVVFVEGDHPGSTYFGAELHLDVDEVNEVAKSLDIPIRFAQEKA